MHTAASAPIAPQTLEQFDPKSGSLLERAVFNNRRLVMLACAVVTVLLAALAATKLTLGASFDKMIPRSHPVHPELPGEPGRAARPGQRAAHRRREPEGRHLRPAYQATLRKIHDEIFLTPGVDRAWVKSLWAPGVRWTEVTEEGFRGGPVMPDNYDGSAKGDRAAARQHRPRRHRRQPGRQRLQVEHAGRAAARRRGRQGRQGRRRRSASTTASCRRRSRRSAPGSRPTARCKMHVIGFAKLVGDLIDGLLQVSLYFGLAALIAAAIIWLYTRCLRSTALVMACSLVAVVWLLGLIAAFGFELDPYSILVPFLVFAIGVSHGAQKMNGIMQDIGRGAHRLVAARYTFRRLFLPASPRCSPTRSASRC
jgi:predicted RND superfamily exporter protein